MRRILRNAIRLHRCTSTDTRFRSTRIPEDGLTMADFLQPAVTKRPLDKGLNTTSAGGPSFFIKTYGCQMNVSDTEIVRSILLEQHFRESDTEAGATVILTNTCAIRENAEQKIWTRLYELRAHYPNSIIGILGCMAERLQDELKPVADVIVGPDAYRSLPELLLSRCQTNDGNYMNVELSKSETYADITPVRKDYSSHSAFVSIQRGCSNRCSFCIVPFTRGTERSRPLDSIVEEVQRLVDQGVREVVLLGQNVNSYNDRSVMVSSSSIELSNPGFRSRTRPQTIGHSFADLLDRVSNIDRDHLRVRFTSPHPKDYPHHLLQLMAERDNLCNHLHMPAQSGSSNVLKRMKRGYTREAYLQLIEDARALIPDGLAISSDFIAGFCDETDQDHEETISLLRQVEFDQAYMFAYSMRNQTYAAKQFKDNVPMEVKKRRLQEIIDTFHEVVMKKNHREEVGRVRLVLVEGASRRSQPSSVQWHGRTDQNKRIVFSVDLQDATTANSFSIREGTILQPTTLKVGDYAVVEVTKARGHSLQGRLLWREDSITSFSKLSSIAVERLVVNQKPLIGLDSEFSSECNLINT